MNRAPAASARGERRLDAVMSYGLLTFSALFALLPVAWMLSPSLKSEEKRP